MRDLKGGVRTEVGGRGIRQLRREWGRWLSRFPWDHFVTLTFRTRADPDCARRRFARWIRDLERRAQGQVLWAVAPEWTMVNHVHLHCLLSGTCDLDRRAIESSWLPGFVRSDRYDDRRGASYYLAKAIEDEWCEVDLDRRLVRSDRAKLAVIEMGSAGDRLIYSGDVITPWNVVTL